MRQIVSFTGLEVAEFAVWVYFFVWMEGSPANRMIKILRGKTHSGSFIVYELCISGLFLGIAVFFLFIFLLMLFYVYFPHKEIRTKEMGGVK